MRGGSSEEMSSTCVQGNTPCNIYEQCLSRINQNVTTWQQFHQPIIPKMEPIEVNMETDIKPSSNEYYNTIPRTSNNSPVEYRRNPSNFMYNTVPLTPPDSDHMVSPNLHRNSPAQSTEATSISSTYHQTNVSSPAFSASSTLSPSTSYQTSRLSPATSTPVTYQSPNMPQTYSPQRVQSSPPSPNELTTNPLQNLQKSFESSEFLSSPRRNSASSNDETKTHNPDEDIRKPKVNSNGKVKVHKCKQCKFVAQTKQDFWDHQRIHIKPEKLLTCPKCPFVTEFKHHLEYHILNHSGSKPFKCDQCDYRCVNKSMLSSHMKCHSDIHQYRCMDCNYTSKYCHSLKLHLRKYQHYPDKVLNPDGSVNPFIVIDVEGTRRGPKMKQSKHMHQNQSQISPPQMGPILPYPMQPQFMFNPSQFPFPFPLLNNLQVQNPLLLQNLQQLVKEQQSRLTAEQPMVQDEASSSRSSPELPESEALDLSVSNQLDREVKPKNRRKGVAFKLNNIQANANSDDDSDEETTTMFSNVEVVQSEDTDGKTSPMEEESRNSNGSPNNDSNNNNNNNKSKSSDYICQYCGINYTDAVLYTIHMGYHGFQNPFTCNMCGAQCGDKISFTLHIAREPHL